MLSVDILRHIPMSDGVQVVGRLDVNMATYVNIGVTQELGQSTEAATSQKLLTDIVENISNVIGKLEALNTVDSSSTVAAINELVDEISRINTIIASDLSSSIGYLETELAKRVKQSDLMFGSSYLPYYSGESQ